MSSGHQRITWRRNIAENFNRLSRVHERYRQTDDRQTDGRRHIANMNMSSRSLKNVSLHTGQFMRIYYNHIAHLKQRKREKVQHIDMYVM